MAVILTFQILRFLGAPLWAGTSWSPVEQEALQQYRAPQYLSHVRRERLRGNGGEFLAFMTDTEKEREQDALQTSSRKLREEGVVGFLDRRDWAMWVERKHDQ